MYEYNIDNVRYFSIGIKDENKANIIRINVSSWLKDFPGANFNILAIRPTEENFYIADTIRNGDYLEWVVGAYDTAIAGQGKVEIRCMTDEVVKKTKVCTTEIIPSLHGTSGDTPPESQKTWVDNVILVTTQNAEIAQNAADSASDYKDQAASSAESASTSEYNALQSETSAQASAISAAESAAEAQRIKDSIDLSNYYNKDETDALLSILQREIDDIADVEQEYESSIYFPKVGKAGVLYIDKEHNSIHRWSEEDLKYYCIGRDYEEIQIINGGIL